MIDYMHLHQPPKYHRFPVSIISHAVCRYHRFNDRLQRYRRRASLQSHHCEPRSDTFMAILRKL